MLDPKLLAQFAPDTQATTPSGMIMCANAAQGTSPWCRQYAIGGEAYAYLVQEHIYRKKMSVAQTLVFGEEVKYSTDERRIVYLGDDGKKHERVNRKLFVRDNRGKTREMEIVSKLKQPPQGSGQP